MHTSKERWWYSYNVSHSSIHYTSGIVAWAIVVGLLFTMLVLFCIFFTNCESWCQYLIQLKCAWSQHWSCCKLRHSNKLRSKNELIFFICVTNEVACWQLWSCSIDRSNMEIDIEKNNQRDVLLVKSLSKKVKSRVLFTCHGA
jgi:hypothetical protein